NAGGLYGDRHVHQAWRTWSAQYLAPAGKDVVDIGCGAGIYAGGFARMGARAVTGVDITEQYLLEAKAQYAQTPNMSFVLGTANATGLASACADIVFQRAVIHHLNDTEQLASARENFRVLRAGGVCAIQDRTLEDVKATDPAYWIRATLFEVFPQLVQFEATRRPVTERYSAHLTVAGFHDIEIVSVPEVRRVYGTFESLESEILSRKGKSILFELSDTELRRYCDVLAQRAPAHDLREVDPWTVWIARAGEAHA
ncbi:MAG: ubiquinone/menaquinone biosynthesis C-methylase UbiE, partial [Gammaproteobacteria bacterium]